MSDLVNLYPLVINNYNSKGWIIFREFFSKKEIIEIKKEILNKIKTRKYNKNFYYELINKKNRLRRIEKVSEFSKAAKKIIYSKKILDLINFIKKKKFELFKDKLNFKYPGGQGYLPHIDGHFIWRDRKNKKQNGWKKYSDDFINLVIPLEKSNKKNGCIYVADISDTKKLGTSFNKITKKMILGTPNINQRDIKKFKFNSIELKEGDICLFDWKCAHFSKNNNSKNSRMIFYATYYKKNKIKNVRSKYYYDKQTSLNDRRNKSLLFS